MVRRCNGEIGHYFSNAHTSRDRPSPPHSRAPPATGGRCGPMCGLGSTPQPSGPRRRNTESPPSFMVYAP